VVIHNCSLLWMGKIAWDLGGCNFLLSVGT
jgi:hypothetical protein